MYEMKCLTITEYRIGVCVFGTLSRYRMQWTQSEQWLIFNCKFLYEYFIYKILSMFYICTPAVKVYIFTNYAINERIVLIFSSFSNRKTRTLKMSFKNLF